MKYIAPARGLPSFTCPHCGVLARQYPFSVTDKSLGGNSIYKAHDWLSSSVCEHCKDATLWIAGRMIYPSRGDAPAPNPDMPADVRQDYEEAAVIARASPKAAAALLRLAIQKLCVHLGATGKNINEDVRTLVQRGLAPQIQQALDVVRVVGNNAVHPGQIDLDGSDIVSHLFGLLNIIVESMISTPNRISALYSGLPQSARDAIAKRDAKPGSASE